MELVLLGFSTRPCRKPNVLRGSAAETPPPPTFYLSISGSLILNSNISCRKSKISHFLFLNLGPPILPGDSLMGTRPPPTIKHACFQRAEEEPGLLILQEGQIFKVRGVASAGGVAFYLPWLKQPPWANQEAAFPRQMC